MTTLTPVAMDIETTGFGATDRVTVLGFALPLGCRVFLTTDGRTVDADALERRVGATVGTTVQLSVHDTEPALFAAIETYVTESLVDRAYLLVAYNGERYRGGFDLPFLRTRLALTDQPWPFGDLPYADLLPLVRHRFNTVVDGDATNDLDAAYETLVGGEFTAHDPFAESAAAVEAYDTGAFEPLVQHNVVDVLRTAALAALSERYCGKSDFQVKSLTPARPVR